MHVFLCFFDFSQLDVAVLKYKNQKLVEQVEAQKVEYLVLEDKLNQLKEKQKTYTGTLTVVNESWDRVILLVCNLKYPLNLV